MRFTEPLFLFALLLVIIPILIHFFQFKRYKTVYFSQVGFLKVIRQESKKKNDLKQLLILLLRILAVIFLVLAFSQPYFPVNPGEQQTNRQLIGIYIDNSFSMKNQSGNGVLLELAKNRAIDIANSYGPGTNFILATNQPETAYRQILNKEQFVAAVARIKESPASLKLSKAHQLLNNYFEKAAEKTGKTCYLLSDFQKYSSDFNQLKTDSSQQLVLVPFETGLTNNLLVDTCWFESPGRRQNQTETLYVRVRNQSNQTFQNIPLRLLMNDSLKAVSSLTIGPDEETVLELNYRNNTQGVHRGKVELDDYPVVFDNSFFFSYQVEQKVNVLAIYNKEQDAIQLLEKLYLDDENIHFSAMDERKMQLSLIHDYQCVFLLNLDELSGGLSAALVEFVSNGGTLNVFPGRNANLPNYNSFYRQLTDGYIAAKDTNRLKMAGLNYKHPLFRDVFLHENEKLDLPYLNESFRFRTGTNTVEFIVMTNNNGSTAVAEYPSGTGRLFQFNFTLAPQFTDFYKQAVFVPVMYNIALNSYEPQTIQYNLGDVPVIELRKPSDFTEGQFLSISNESGEKSQLPVIVSRTNYFRINPSAFTGEAGFYELSREQGQLKTLAFNYSRQESLSDRFQTDEIRKMTGDWDPQPLIIDGEQPDFSKKIQETNQGTETWKLCILLGLLFLLAEPAITRFWKS
ncbi:BatA domain-containing protein [Gaoshiqia sp. Z1-71]|uniref:BatA domain-containing protein n=1 Tax=Gaoshiqia hydrogeniformans TaxID=3290090 RepID=UPI003BF8D7E5